MAKRKASGKSLSKSKKKRKAGSPAKGNRPAKKKARVTSKKRGRGKKSRRIAAKKRRTESKSAPNRKKRKTGKKKRRAPKKRRVRHVHPSRRLRFSLSDVRQLGIKGWKKFILKKRPRSNLDLERAAAQLAERYAEKVVGGGHEQGSPAEQILIALMVAEQAGTLNEEYYDQAGAFDEYETPQDVYRLWIYSGR